MTRRLGHAYEIYPLFFLVGVWFVAFCGFSLWSFGKVEVWLDRSMIWNLNASISCAYILGQKLPPWDWTKIRDNYWKLPTVVYDPEGKTRRRCEIMEVLEVK